MKIIRAAITACAITASMFGAITPPTAAAPTPVNGPCLFGHVDPNNANSACKGSDSANWPESEANPDGSPKLSCSRLNKGAGVARELRRMGIDLDQITAQLRATMDSERFRAVRNRARFLDGRVVEHSLMAVW